MKLDPVILFFALGLLAHWLKSDLKVPKALYEALSIFLLLALGLKGGAEVVKHPLAEILPEVALVLAMGLLLPLIAFALLRSFFKVDRINAGSIAAHYGSVSVVTFAAALAWLDNRDVQYESFLALFMVILEVPALIVGVVLARGASAKNFGPMLHEVFTGKSILLLVGGLAIGAALGDPGMKPISPFFTDLFRGALCIFMLELGLVAGQKAGQLKASAIGLMVFAMVTPLLFGLIGAGFGGLMGLSTGGAMIMATLAASASYIAAPTAMRVALPEANEALSLPIVLGITFPFNVLVGLPIYFQYARWVTQG
jgi:uncharacterized protein